MKSEIFWKFYKFAKVFVYVYIIFDDSLEERRWSEMKGMKNS